MTNLNYPKYQASFFLTKEDQLVVRTDDKKEFKEMLKYVKDIKDAAGVVKSELKCEQCGAEAVEKSGTSKAGKPWRAIFCTKDKTHVKWL